MKEYYVAPSADLIGNVELGDDASIWYHAVVRGDHDKIIIGKGSNIQDGCVLHADEGYPVVIGEDVTIGHNAIVHGCKVGTGSLIGMGAIILNGAQIGENCIIAAGALVIQGCVIPDGMMAIGSPAKVKRAVTPEEIEANMHNTKEYVQFAKQTLEKRCEKI